MRRILIGILATLAALTAVSALAGDITARELQADPATCEGRSFVLRQAALLGKLETVKGEPVFHVQADGIVFPAEEKAQILFAPGPGLQKQFTRYFKPHYRYTVNLFGTVEKSAQGGFRARVERIEHLTEGGAVYNALQ
jgi:hypothetical protein